MAEYNLMYQDLKKRLTVLKILTETDCTLNESVRSSRESIIDSLLKELDYRRQEHLYLEGIEVNVINLERQ